jgi:ribosomal protein L32
MSDLRTAAQQALEALDESLQMLLPKAQSDKCRRASFALRAALAQQEEGRMEFHIKETVCAKCGSTNGAHSHDCPVAKAALAQPEQATVKESLPVGQEEPEGGWQSAPSPQVTQRIADMPMSEYRRGVNDGFKLGLREGRIKAEDEMREQQEQEPGAWIQPDHLQKARQAPFLCRVEPTKRMSDFVPFYTHPPRREWQSLTEEEIGDVFQAARNAKLGSANDNSRHRLSVVEIARAIEQACKERNT